MIFFVKFSFKYVCPVSNQRIPYKDYTMIHCWLDAKLFLGIGICYSLFHHCIFYLDCSCTFPARQTKVVTWCECTNYGAKGHPKTDNDNSRFRHEIPQLTWFDGFFSGKCAHEVYVLNVKVFNYGIILNVLSIF